MTIDEAIKDLTSLYEVSEGVWYNHIRDAIKLGNEALETIQAIREEHFSFLHIPLQSETKD